MKCLTSRKPNGSGSVIERRNLPRVGHVAELGGPFEMIAKGLLSIRISKFRRLTMPDSRLQRARFP
jgi:hypothetical protein